MIVRAAVVVVALSMPGLADARAQDKPVNEEVRAAARAISGGDQDGGLRRLEALAGAGDLDAHNLLGELYSGMGGVPRDRPKACEHFRIAREARPSAAHNYGQCLWEGAFGERDFVQARFWYGRGAEGGFLQAKCALGNMLIKGQGGPVDAESGVALCREAAEAGEPNAQADMGDYYRAGQGVPQDHAEARRWYRLAADQNQRNAAFNLGAMDWSGVGGPVDLARAADWMEIAYAAGRKDAAFFAGLSYLRQAVPNAPAGPVDLVLLAQAKPWLETAMREDSNEDRRAQAAVTLAQISGYEEMARLQADR